MLDHLKTVAVVSSVPARRARHPTDTRVILHKELFNAVETFSIALQELGQDRGIDIASHTFTDDKVDLNKILPADLYACVAWDIEEHPTQVFTVGRTILEKEHDMV